MNLRWIQRTLRVAVAGLLALTALAIGWPLADAPDPPDLRSDVQLAADRSAGSGGEPSPPAVETWAEAWSVDLRRPLSPEPEPKPEPDPAPKRTPPPSPPSGVTLLAIVGEQPADGELSRSAVFDTGQRGVEVFRAGDWVAGVRILRIEHNRVVFERQGEEVNMMLPR
ncbi:MAG: hypothetical protein ACOCTI_08545 [Phycisphaeraceae bacterium]